MRKKILLLNLLVLVVVFILNTIGIVYDLYYTTWYDIITHFLGGAWVAIAALLFIPESVSFRSKALLMLGAVVLIGGGWEVFEYGLTFISGDELLDTPEDLFVDFAGGLCAVLFIRRYFQWS